MHVSALLDKSISSSAPPAYFVLFVAYFSEVPSLNHLLHRNGISLVHSPELLRNALQFDFINKPDSDFPIFFVLSISCQAVGLSTSIMNFDRPSLVMRAPRVNAS